ncbi:MAG: hypothetical protein GY789_01270 [Hyphomicrobiales bacterium]|nr:hypothetical protein [Hyphomicrobiales bacterium]
MVLITGWLTTRRVARNTTFTYKGQAVDVQAVAHELGVRYVLEGSVRKAGNRISVQLNDGEKGFRLYIYA